MIQLAGCKINLGLYILGKRSDGYHNLKSLMFPVPWYDILEIVPSQSFGFYSSGLKIDGEISDNLVVKAYKLLSTEFSLPPVNIHLHKSIPFGAGLGGGSSDAASTLILLDKLFNLNLSSNHLKSLSAKLGSDCPFFVENLPAIVSETGTTMNAYPFSLPGYWLLVVKPDVEVSTKIAYSMIDTYSNENELDIALKLPVEQWKTKLRNDFSLPIINRYPEIGKLIQSLYNQGAVYAEMSGSGSAVFGLFTHEPKLIFSPKYIHKTFLL